MVAIVIVVVLGGRDETMVELRFDGGVDDPHIVNVIRYGLRKVDTRCRGRSIIPKPP